MVILARGRIPLEAERRGPARAPHTVRTWKRPGRRRQAGPRG